MTSLTLSEPCQASLQCSWGGCKVVRYCNLPSLMIAGLTHSLNKCKEDVTHEGRACNQIHTRQGGSGGTLQDSPPRQQGDTLRLP